MLKICCNYNFYLFHFINCLLCNIHNLQYSQFNTINSDKHNKTESHNSLDSKILIFTAELASMFTIAGSEVAIFGTSEWSQLFGRQDREILEYAADLKVILFLNLKRLAPVAADVLAYIF